MKDFLLGFFRDEDGLETVEMVIILVVIVGMAVIFRNKIAGWFKQALGQAENYGQDIGNNPLGNSGGGS